MKNSSLRLIILIQLICYASNAQTIKVERIPYKSYDFHVSLKSDFVDKTTIPSSFGVATGIATHASTSQIPDTIATIKQQMAEWRNKNKPVDEGNTAVKYGLVRTEKGYYVRKFNTVVTYGYEEIGGGFRVQRYLKIVEKDFLELLCLFNDSITDHEYKGLLYPINLPDRMVRNDIVFGFEDKVLMNNIRLSFTHENRNYSIDYTGDLCEKGVSLDGSGTTQPVHINIRINLIDDSGKKHQIILQRPDGHDFGLAGISYGDIDNDGRLDIILSILYGSCKYNLVYLSSRRSGESLVGYVGYYEVGRIDP